MKTFRYERAETAGDAVALLQERPGAKILAGGSNLVDLMRLGVERPDSLIDVTHLALDRIESLPDGTLRIGAGVRNSDLSAHPLVRRSYPVLAEAVESGASGQIRNVATTAGNLLQRTRCRYFQDVTMPCNKRRPGSGCPAIEGDHRHLAVLGTSDQCVATHPSDMAVAMVALDAMVGILGPAGQRSLPVDGLYLLPGDTPHREYAIGPDEMLLAVDVPAMEATSRSAYRKARERASYAFALASCAVVLRMDGPRVARIRIGLGGVAPKPWRAREAEAWLRGQTPRPEVVAEAMDRELASARPLRDNGFKLPLVRDLTVATVRDLAGVPS